MIQIHPKEEGIRWAKAPCTPLPFKYAVLKHAYLCTLRGLAKYRRKETYQVINTMLADASVLSRALVSVLRYCNLFKLFIYPEKFVALLLRRGARGRQAQVYNSYQNFASSEP